jgi:hypothetical protein
MLKGYPVTNLFDKKNDTAWVEGVTGDGIGEWVSLDIHTVKKDSPSSITTVGVIPGYLKTDNRWEENNRVKTALLIIKASVSTYYNLDDYAIFRLKFNDFKGLQLFHIKFAGRQAYDFKVWLIIEEVSKGTKYSDTCISELYIEGGCHPPEPY